MSLYTMITAVLALAGLVMTVLGLLSGSSFGANHQIREATNHNLSRAKFWRVAIYNAVLSIGLVYGYTYLLRDRLFHEGPVSVLRCLGEGAAILLLFDFFYYLVHRYPFHEWKILRGVHAVHHIVRNPTAVDSLYQHPLENFLGLTLLWACIALVTLVGGPVSTYSFAWVFLVYSLLNVVVHAGLNLRGPGMSLITHLATRHNKHHTNMNGKNYASVTPIWDLVFRTEEP